MVKRIDNKETLSATKIYDIFQASYSVEAAILNVKDFPPLRRSVENFLESETEFYATHARGKMSGIIEIETIDSKTEIHSLVVHPHFFRLGLGSKLLTFIEEEKSSLLFLVETGVNNIPAVKLYEKHGYVKYEEWTIDIGIRKVKLKKRKVI